MADERNEADEKRQFFRFYSDGAYEEEGAELETKEMYEKVFHAMAEAGVLPEEFIGKKGEKETTYDKIVKRCRELDDEVQNGTGDIKEKQIGLQGFFNDIIIP